MSQSDQRAIAHIRLMRPDEADLCEAILRDLPNWFGIEESIVQYGKDISSMETYVADLGETVGGFLTLAQHNPHTAEIHVIATRPQYHRQGLGRALVAYAEQALKQRGTSYLEVKTVGPSRACEYYRRTRAFYVAMGFCPVEENKLWGEANPCLIMIKHLTCHGPAS